MMKSWLRRCTGLSLFALGCFAVPAHAAGPRQFLKERLAPSPEHPHTATARFSAHQSGADSDPVLLLLFGSGLLGCAGLCVVQSHREEKRRSERAEPRDGGRQDPGSFVRWESA